MNMKMPAADLIMQARSLFTDKISLRIFDKRVEIGQDVKKAMFPETLELIGLTESDKARFLHLVEELQNPKREKYIYGAGVGCKSVLERECMHVINAQNIVGIIDNYVKEERYGLRVIAFAEFVEKHKDALVLNSVGVPAGKAIHKQCTDAGVEVISLFELDKSWDQYFDLPKELGVVGDGEVFVHAGCYNGDTQKSYINWFGETYEKMVTFEPNEKQFNFCRELFQKFTNIGVVQAGLSDKTQTVRFDLDMPGRSFISETGSEEIKVVSLDEFMRGEKVTFIALDIEGEELKALQGAEHIIRTQKPKLAISAYHKFEDIYELPLQVKSFNPDYKLYLRHYHLLDMAETVMYAL